MDSGARFQRPCLLTRYTLHFLTPARFWWLLVRETARLRKRGAHPARPIVPPTVLARWFSIPSANKLSPRFQFHGTCFATQWCSCRAAGCSSTAARSGMILFTDNRWHPFSLPLRIPSPQLTIWPTGAGTRRLSLLGTAG